MLAFSIFLFELARGFVEHVGFSESIEKLKHVSKDLFSIFQVFDPRFRKRYLAAIARKHQRLDLIGDERLVRRLQPRLQEVFLPLRLTDGTAILRWHDIFSQEERRLVILGNPGSGKSTLLSYLALLFSGRVSSPLCEQTGNPLPLFARLRDLGKGSGSLLDLLNDSIGMHTRPRNFAELQLRKGNCIVLLDGLDEVFDDKLQKRVHEEIGGLADDYPNNWIIVTCRAASWQNNQLSGFQAFEIQQLDRDDIRRFIGDWHREVEQSTPGRGKAAQTEAKISSKAGRLWNSLVNQEELLRTASNPLMLSIITLVNFRCDAALPKGRAAFYAECIRILLDRSGHGPSHSSSAHDQKLIVLRAIAFHSLREDLLDLPLRGLAKNVANYLSDLPELEEKTVQYIIDQLSQRPDLLVASPDSSRFSFIHRSLRDFLAAAHIVEGGLYGQLGRRLHHESWREVVLNVIGFTDREKASELVTEILRKTDGTEAELAALALAEREKSDLSETLWQTVLGRLKSRLEAVVIVGDFRRLANALMAADPDAARDWLAESLQRDGSRRRWIIEFLPTLGKPHGGPLPTILVQLLGEREEDPKVREQAALALAVLGSEDEDDILNALRKAREENGHRGLQAAVTWALCELGQHESLGLVKVEAGEFQMGDDNNIVYLSSYYIGKYPVTVKDFKEFIVQKRYRPKDPECTTGQDLHPVTWVSWYDALEYAQMQGFGLPSEAEWEKAARSTDGRKFPWGNHWERGRANTREHLRERTRKWLLFHRDLDRWDRTTPVGELPHGESLYHCHDMAGNVWEWTRSLWGEGREKSAFCYPYVPTDGREDLLAPKSIYRVVRGGSFRHHHQSCRCACRHQYLPERGLLDIGFRVVSSPPSSL